MGTRKGESKKVYILKYKQLLRQIIALFKQAMLIGCFIVTSAGPKAQFLYNSVFLPDLVS